MGPNITRTEPTGEGQIALTLVAGSNRTAHKTIVAKTLFIIIIRYYIYYIKAGQLQHICPLPYNYITIFAGYTS